MCRAFPGFPSAKEIYECGVIAAVSLLVESVVFDGPVNGTYDRPCGQQAQFQDVFQRARVRGNGIVFGHAEGIDHVRGSLTVWDGSENTEKDVNQWRTMWLRLAKVRSLG